MIDAQVRGSIEDRKQVTMPSVEGDHRVPH